MRFELGLHVESVVAMFPGIVATNADDAEGQNWRVRASPPVRLHFKSHGAMKARHDIVSARQLKTGHHALYRRAAK
jgi:hypothetical protein